MLSSRRATRNWLSSLTQLGKLGICLFFTGIAILSLALLSHVQAAPASAPSRPRILGIANVTILTTDSGAATDFYRMTILPGTMCKECERPPVRVFGFVTGQTVTLRDAPAAASNLLLEVSFVTENLENLRKFLEADGIKVEQEKSATGAPARPIVTRDPEGHRISFVESSYMLSKHEMISNADVAGPLRIIHAGFVVHDRAAEDKFYKDILGFHVYWHGGMKEGEDNWVDMQVPDGTDWIEYMLRVSPDASHKTLGVMNHIALGVPDIHAAQQQLIKNGWKSNEEPKIGRDGKWQLNLYDPDETRVELMEFKPTKEPCCSAYTGLHPGPPQ
jgi:catechol 2,3-dioxygenase-like lactoylglutathione lyase family enzyme